MDEIVLGRTYQDCVSGFEGIAVHKTQFLYACERVCLQTQAEKGEIKEIHVDAPQLVLVPKGKTINVPELAGRTGGARPGHVARTDSAR